MHKIYLSRRNLMALLSKLDRVKRGEHSACSIIKSDNLHPKYAQSMQDCMVTAVEDAALSCEVTAVEDEDYYTERPAGAVHPKDAPKLPVCRLCNDTHKIVKNTMIMDCTACPLPCEKCRNGSFCTSTPCSCDCHKKST